MNVATSATAIPGSNKSTHPPPWRARKQLDFNPVRAHKPTILHITSLDLYTSLRHLKEHKHKHKYNGAAQIRNFSFDTGEPT